MNVTGASNWNPESRRRRGGRIFWRRHYRRRRRRPILTPPTRHDFVTRRKASGHAIGERVNDSDAACLRIVSPWCSGLWCFSTRAPQTPQRIIQLSLFRTVTTLSINFFRVTAALLLYQQKITNKIILLLDFISSWKKHYFINILLCLEKVKINKKPRKKLIFLVH